MLQQQSALQVSMLSQVADERLRKQMQAEMEATLAASKARADDLIAQSAHCEGVGPVGPQTIARQWREAAIAGHVPSMTHYAVGNAFRINQTLQNLEALAIYKREAESFARRAADLGDYNAAVVLAAAYSPLDEGANRTYRAQVVKPDGVQSLRSTCVSDRRSIKRRRVIGSSALKAVQDHITHLASLLWPEQRAQAQRRARQPVAVAHPGGRAGTVVGGERYAFGYHAGGLQRLSRNA